MRDANAEQRTTPLSSSETLVMSTHDTSLLALLGIAEGDIDRYRGAYVRTFAEDDGEDMYEPDSRPAGNAQEPWGRYIVVDTRTGGNNRMCDHNYALMHHPLFVWTDDDPGDSTYARFYFRMPAEATERGGGDE
ncbi:MAG TPA: hypothetical protein VMV29_22790 [Ktedonobacterales bacterium]|nr:hypothetical protein [Ktedonobacterales bacterium]